VSRWTGDGGRVSAFVTIMVVALLLVTGLVIDGGLALGVKVRAIGVAEEAARTGAQHIDLAVYRDTGQIQLRADEATSAARTYLATAGMSGTVTVAGNQVTVTVNGSQRTQLLGMIGIHKLAVTASASAEPRYGVDGPER